MQPTLELNWWSSARFGGVMRYQRKSLGKTIRIVLLILTGAQLLSLLFPLITGHAYPYSGVFADVIVTMIVSLICASIAAHSGTRFLLRFGTSRLSVWLGNLVSLSIGMIVLLLGTFALSLLTGGLVLGLSAAIPARFSVNTLYTETTAIALFQTTLRSSLTSLPANLLYTVEWVCLFYLLGTCMRRKTWLTLTVIIGLPMLIFTLTLVPAVRQAAEAVSHANDQQIMLLGIQWMKAVVDFFHFVEHEWPTIQLVSAIVSLPLSYLCMRDTQQP